MKIVAIYLFLLLPAAVVAQGYPQMNEGDMQMMQEQMQAAQVCMQDIDMVRVHELGERAKLFQSELESLCANGQRDVAMDKAVAFAKDMQADPDIQKMQACTENMRGMMPVMPYSKPEEVAGASAGHVCD